VLKTCRADQLNDTIAPAMLRREAMASKSIAHANLISVLSAVPTDSCPYSIYPYLEGVTLQRLLPAPRLRLLSVSQAISVTRQIAAALAAVHAAGWLHGQVRPEHIIVSPHGNATLIDLTCARRLDSSECDCAALALAASESSLPAYAAPEWFASRGRLTGAADIYSLGTVLFEALAGRPPFAAGNGGQLIAAHRCEAPPDLRALRYDLSRDVAHVARLMLAKEPLRRPSAEQLVRWLAELEIEELAVGCVERSETHQCDNGALRFAPRTKSEPARGDKKDRASPSDAGS
jgi:serine/threonine-protein kinase